MSGDRYSIDEASQRSIRVRALGMDQRQRNRLRLLFESKCQNRYVLAEGSVAEIYMLDLDVFGGRRLWEEFRARNPSCPLIIFSLSPLETSEPYTLFVQKPIAVRRLIEVIEQHRSCLAESGEPPLIDSPVAAAQSGDGLKKSLELSREISFKRPPPQAKPSTRKAASLMSGAAEQAFVGTSPDIDPTQREQLAKIYYDPGLYLQGHFLKALQYAKRLKKNVAIEGPWPTVCIYNDRDSVRVSARERQFRPHCTLPDATREIRLRTLSESAPTHDHPEIYSCSVTGFLWQLSLWASRGRLPEGTDITRPVRLRRWPNFTRLVITPHAMAITALWANQPCSLIDTARILNIPQRYVFALYSAAHALQLVELGALPNPLAETQRQPLGRSKKRGTLGRLLGYLKGQLTNPAPPPESGWQ